VNVLWLLMTAVIVVLLLIINLKKLPSLRFVVEQAAALVSHLIV